MKVKLLWDRVLVRRLEEEEKTASGIIIPDTAKEKPQIGVVVEVGPGKLLKDGKLLPLEVKKGDKVVFQKYSGSEFKIKGEEHLIMHEDDLLGILEEDEEKGKKKK
jgi:chaperonin GroES